MKNKLLILLFVLFSLSFNAVLADKLEDAVKIYNEAIDTYNANEIDNAIQKIPEVFSIISQERISTFY